jgi:DNA-binding winged helix-turn-helix (wHTH) protein
MTLSNLRRKLAATGAMPPIVTLPGRGYMLEAS